MRKFKLGLTSVSSLVFVLATPAAVAGSCGAYGGLNCGPGVSYNSTGVPVADPLLVNIAQPLGGMRSVHIRSAPSVSITRLYGQQHALAGLADAPSGFTGGCNPTTTQYCRQSVGGFQSANFNVAQIQAPIIAAPAPIISQPIQPSVRFASGYNPSAYAPRQYGEDVFTPGIAHIPTSYVDRSPLTAERLLSSGATRSHSNFSLSSAPSVHIAQPASSYTSSASHSFASTASVSGPTTPVEADGGYWEEVSGPTLFGDTLATRVICRRQAPVVQQEVQVQAQVQTQQVYTQVVRPVVAVPTPVPVICAPSEVKSRYAFSQNVAAPQPSFGQFQGHQFQGNQFQGNQFQGHQFQGHQFQGGHLPQVPYAGFNNGYSAAPQGRWSR